MMSNNIQPASSDLYHPKKGMPEWGPRYLEALEQAQGAKVRAAELIGKNYKSVYNAGQKHPEFFEAIRKIRARWDDQNQAELESISMNQAKKAGNTVERFFQLKALDPSRYRDHSQPTTPTINIVMGFHIPDVPETSGQVMDDEPDELELPTYAIVVDAEEGKPTRSKRRRPTDDVLGDEDVNIEL